MGPSLRPQAKGLLHVQRHPPNLAERQALGCTQVCETEGANCSLSDWKVLGPTWHQMKRNQRCPIALLETTLLLKSDDY